MHRSFDLPRGTPMNEQRLQMLQNVPIFGGIRVEILDFILHKAPEITLPELMTHVKVSASL